MRVLQGRSGNVVGAAACAAMLGFAIFAEKILGLAPCPLCMFQRVGVLAIGIVFALAALHAPGRAGARVYAVLIVLAAATTIGVAARHVYVQALPPGTVPACGASLDFLLEAFPLADVVRKVMTGGGECARIDWRFLGLSMPAWVLVAATFLGAFGVYVNSDRRTPK
ncbi:MAG: Disulfide bond formation protein B [Steroidobacteraceae bacterium]|nr:Disulfide bond formation protein B [Steroidobacteraceae bacterium]